MVCITETRPQNNCIAKMPADERLASICFSILLHLTCQADRTLLQTLQQCLFRYLEVENDKKLKAIYTMVVDEIYETII